MPRYLSSQSNVSFSTRANLVNLAHAAGAQQRDDAIVRNGPADDHVWMRWAQHTPRADRVLYSFYSLRHFRWQPWVHRQSDRDLSPIKALQPRRLRAARPLAHRRQRRVHLPDRPERRREVDLPASIAARRSAERGRAEGPGT